MGSSLGSMKSSQKKKMPQQRNMQAMNQVFAQQVPVPSQAIEPGSYADDDEITPSTVAPIAEPRPEAEGSRVGSLSISTKVEYAAIPGDRAQDIFGLVTVEASTEVARPSGTEPRQPLDLVCVLDVSGSMDGDKICLLQDAVQFVVRESLPHDRLSIVAFNDSATRALRLCRMCGNGKEEAAASVARLSADGGTRIASGLQAAVEVMEQRRQRNPVSAILLLTDGQDDAARHELPPLIRRAQAVGCSLYAFGFGADHDAKLLLEVAEHAQTPFTFVEDVDQIKSAFAGAVGGLASVAAQRVEVTLRCGSATLKALHTPFPVTRDGSAATIQIPDMLAGERRDIVVELSVPVEPGSADGSAGTLLLTASAKYWDLANGSAAQTPDSEMRLVRLVVGDEPQPEMEPDEEVATQRARVEVAEVLQRAAALGEAGQFSEAQSVLSAQEGRVRSAKKCKAAVSELLAAELQDAHNRMQSRTEWENGGAAELRDAMQMHKMQRATNMNVSKKCAVGQKRACKAMYAAPMAQMMIEKCEEE